MWWFKPVIPAQAEVGVGGRVRRTEAEPEAERSLQVKGLPGLCSQF